MSNFSKYVYEIDENTNKSEKLTRLLTFGLVSHGRKFT